MFRTLIIALVGIFQLSSMAFAASADKIAVLKLLIDNKDLQPLDLAGQPMGSTVGSLLAEALAEENITVTGECVVEKASVHESCALDITSVSKNGLRQGYTFSFEKAQNVIIDNKVTLVIAL